MRIPGGQRGRSAAGVGIMLALLGMAVLIYALEDLLALFSSETRVLAVVPDAVRIVAGAPVWIAGREVGQVRSVRFLPVRAGPGTTPQVIMALAIPDRLRDQLRVDAHVRVTTAGIMGEPVVDIRPGSAELPVLPAGDTLGGAPLPTREQLMAQAATLRARIDTLLAEVAVVGPRAGAAMQRYGRVAEGAGRAGRELSELRATLTERPAFGTLRSAAFEASVAGARAHAAALGPELAAFGARLDSLRARARPVTDRMAVRADTLAERLAVLEAGLSVEGGILGRMRTDSALVKALHGARAQLDSLIAEVTADPLRFVF